MAAIDTLALLRALNTPASQLADSDPSFAGLFPGIGSTAGAALTRTRPNPLSAKMSDTSFTGLFPGIGSTDSTGILRMKDPAGVRAAAQAWQDTIGEANPYDGMIFGDTPGGAQSNLLNLRSQNISRALRMAEMAAQERARQDSLAAQQQYHNAANQRASQNDWLDFLAQVTGRQQDASRQNAVSRARNSLAGQMQALTGQRSALDAQDVSAMGSEDELMNLLMERADAASGAYGSAGSPAKYTIGNDGIPKFQNVAAEQAMWGGGAQDLDVRGMFNKLSADQAQRKSQRTSLSNAIELLLRQYSNPAVQNPGIDLSSIMQAARQGPTVGQAAKRWVFDQKSRSVLPFQ